MSTPERSASAHAGPLGGTVLLATDLGNASAAAETRAVEIAAERAASLVILSVIDPGGLRLPGGGWHARMDQVRRRREDAAIRLVEAARRRGVAARFLIWEGPPGESIVEVARAEAADTVVVGSHNRGRVGRLLLGSVSGHVVRHADCPVVVVRPSADDAGLDDRPIAAGTSDRTADTTEESPEAPARLVIPTPRS